MRVWLCRTAGLKHREKSRGEDQISYSNALPLPRWKQHVTTLPLGHAEEQRRNATTQHRDVRHKNAALQHREHRTCTTERVPTLALIRRQSRPNSCSPATKSACSGAVQRPRDAPWATGMAGAAAAAIGSGAVAAALLDTVPTLPSGPSAAAAAGISSTEPGAPPLDADAVAAAAAAFAASATAAAIAAASAGFARIVFIASACEDGVAAGAFAPPLPPPSCDIPFATFVLPVVWRSTTLSNCLTTPRWILRSKIQLRSRAFFFLLHAHPGIFRTGVFAP